MSDDPIFQRTPPPPVRVDTKKVLLVGIACWAVAFVITWIVPALHTGAKKDWPWIALTGFVLGFVAWAYLAAGRGNAAAADFGDRIAGNGGTTGVH